LHIYRNILDMNGCHVIAVTVVRFGVDGGAETTESDAVYRSKAIDRQDHCRAF
jgi:hypothetical protein